MSHDFFRIWTPAIFVVMCLLLSGCSSSLGVRNSVLVWHTPAFNISATKGRLQGESASGVLIRGLQENDIEVWHEQDIPMENEDLRRVLDSAGRARDLVRTVYQFPFSITLAVKLVRTERSYSDFSLRLTGPDSFHVQILVPRYMQSWRDVVAVERVSHLEPAQAEKLFGVLNGFDMSLRQMIHLLAHELTHVVQQTSGTAYGFWGDEREREAHYMGHCAEALLTGSLAMHGARTSVPESMLGTSAREGLRVKNELVAAFGASVLDGERDAEHWLELMSLCQSRLGGQEWTAGSHRRRVQDAAMSGSALQGSEERASLQ